MKTQANPDRGLESRIQTEMSEAFRARLPQLLEHCMRLCVERLQSGLIKDENTVIGDPTTWRLQPGEIESLSRSIQILNQTRQQINL